MKNMLLQLKRLFSGRDVKEVTLATPPALAPVENPEKALFGARVLFADDNADQHFILRESLEPIGVNLTCVRDGIEALEAARSGSYDIVLMDIDMPILNGYDATLELRLSGYEGPILAITGYIFPDELEKCRSVGFTDHLCKPFSAEMLFEALARHIRR